MRAALLSFTVSTLLLAGCATVRVDVDYDPEEDFSSYRSFAWIPGRSLPLGEAGAPDPLLDKRIVAAVESTLRDKGFRQDPGDPDFRVTYHLSVDQKMDVYSTNRAYVDSWGFVVSIPETRTNVYEEGTLVIDVADAREREVVWRGVGKRRISRSQTPQQVTETVDKAVAEILADFPPKQG